jgi:DNA-binding response OmpR family regulator
MGKLIYFVDDDKMILNLLEYTFSSRDGYSVKTFRKGEDFIASLTEIPDLVVLDHSFVLQTSEYKDGLEILRKMRSNNNNMPVIILSGEQNTDVIEEYNSIGVNKFIAKDSYFIDSLIESIDDVFAPAD